MVTYSALENVRGEITRVVTHFDEITQGKQAEAERQKFVSLADQSSEFIGMWDLEFRPFYFNEAALKLTGLDSLEQACRIAVQEFFFPDDQKFILDEFFPKVLSEGRAEVEIRFRHFKTGEAIWMIYNVFSILGADGKPAAYATVSRNITYRKRAEEALQEKEERLRAALSASETGTFRWNIQTNAIDWDESLDRLFGLPPSQTIRSLENFIAQVHPDERPGVIERCEWSAREGADFDMEFRVIWPDGSVHWLDDKGKTFFDEQGRPSYVTGACVDITARKRDEETLRERARFAMLRADISTALVSGESLPAVLQRISELLVQHLDAAFARIWTLDDEENVLKLQASAGNYTHLNGPHGRVKVGEFKIGRIAQKREPLLTNDVLRDANISDPAWARREGMIAFAGYPILLEGSVLGVMALFARRELSDTAFNELAPIADGLAQWIKRKRAEKALALALEATEHQRRLYDTILSGTPDLVYVFDLNHRFAYANDALLKTWGKTWNEAIGKNFLELGYEPSHAEMHHREIEEVIATKRPVRGEVPFTGTLGRRIYDYIFVPIIGTDGEVEAIAGTTRDVTESRRASEHTAFLAEISKDLTGLATVDEIMRIVGMKIGEYLRLSLCVFVEMEEDGEIAVVNHSWRRGDVPDVTGVHRISDFLSPEFQRLSRAGELRVVDDVAADPLAADERSAAFAALQIRSYITVPLVRDGDWLFMLGAYRSESYDWPADEIDLVREIASRIWTRLERSRAEEALRRSEEKFRAMADNIPQLAWMADSEGWIFWYNRQWFDYTGRTLEEMQGWGWKSVHHPDHVDMVTEKVAHHFKNGLEWEDTFPIRGANGEYRWFLSRMKPIRDASGKVVRFFGTNTDVTDQREAEKLIRKRELLESLVKFQEEERHRLARDLHDHLGQQLTGLRLMLADLLQNSAGAPQIREKVEKAQEKARELDGDVSSLAFELRANISTDHSIADALEQFVSEWSRNYRIRAEFQASGTSAKTKLPDEVETHLYRIAQEALNNAAKHAEAENVAVILDIRQGEVRLIVEDNGVGFNPTVQNGSAPKSVHSFGLVGMRERAELLGGNLEVDSEMGKGTTIFVTVPISL